MMPVSCYLCIFLNVQLGEAAKRNVGTGANQIPDMNSFLCSFASNGYMKFPGGLIVQWTNAGPLVGNSSALLSFPIPFPNQLLVAVPYTGSTVAAQNLGVSVKYETRQSVTLFASPIAVKCNILTSTYIPHPLLSQQAFSRFVQDYLVFGNAYLEKRTNRFGEVIALEPALAKYTRRGLDLDTYWFVQYGMTTQPYQFTKGSIFHLMEPDINQEIYGLPGYLSAIPSALLNESATLFRRKYYINGSHAGFIMYMTDAAQNQEDVNNLRNAMKSAKGPGNFRNLFMYSPNGKKDGLQIIPLSEVAAKDEFLNIKNVSRDDMMAAHRVPPQMMGIMPNNVGGFGDVEKASNVFVRNELLPLQKLIMELNCWLGHEIIRFIPYKLEKAT
ncbi:phage portal protein [Escherichia coli]|nr:phage portal protein [Escherichia coli]MCA7108817.1 phage portal protein [Escherichia coli]